MFQVYEVNHTTGKRYEVGGILTTTQEAFAIVNRKERVAKDMGLKLSYEVIKVK